MNHREVARLAAKDQALSAVRNHAEWMREWVDQYVVAGFDEDEAFTIVMFMLELANHDD